MYLDCGSEDVLLPRVEVLHRALLEHGLAHEYHLYPGGHNSSYWRLHLEEYLRFYAAEWAF
ncbi:MAG: hypothetical protein C4309_06625 [Chloroflexota bacterium]